MNEHIADYLDYYINLDNPQYAVMLIGNWGCGKTFFIKNLVEKWIEPNDKSDNITLKPIYISLNGVSNIHSINEKIKTEINPFLYSKGMKVAKKVLNGLLKTTVKIDMNFDEDEKSDGSFSFNVDSLSVFDPSNKQIKGKRILIFDDIERCKIETDEIFGYINNFVEHSFCKVILLTDEKKIKERYEGNKLELDGSYKDFKEKLIGQTFEVKSDIESAISFFMKEAISLNKKSNLNLYNHLIIGVFKASKLKNLRVIKQALLDFIRLTKIIDVIFEKHVNYSDFIKNFLAYFIIVYAELKTGNHEIKNFQEFTMFDDDRNEEKNQIEEKYRSFFVKHNIYNSILVFPIRKIFDYIENGFIDKREFNDELKVNTFFRSNDEQEWEILWNWRFLDDTNFKRLKDSVWKQFCEEKISEPTILAHITGILLRLVDENLLKQEKEFVLKKSKQIMKKIFQNNVEPKKLLVFGFMDASWSKQYQSHESYEFKSLKDYFSQLLKEKQSKDSRGYLKNIFENIDSESLIEVYEKLKKPIPDKTNTYERTAIFKNIDGKKLGKRIKKFNNTAIHDFKFFIHSRYHPEETYSNMTLVNYHKDDRQCLEDMKNEIGNKLVKKNVIKNLQLLEFKKELELIINKIDTVQLSNKKELR